MDTGHARFDESLHDLEGIEGTAEARFRVGHDGGEPVGVATSGQMLDLVGPEKRLIDAAG